MYCSVCAPSSPHISLFKLYVLFSLLGIGGGDVNWSDLKSLFINPPPPSPLPRTYMGLFTFSHYSNPSVIRQVVIFPLQTAFREHYANICTFLRTFSCSTSLLFVCANFYQFFANIIFFLFFCSSWTNIHRLFASILSSHFLCKQVNFFFLYILAYCSVSIDFLAYIFDSSYSFCEHS